MTIHTQRGSVTVDAFQWLGGKLSTYTLPGFAMRLALQVPGDGYLHVPSHSGVARAGITDWVVLSPDGNVDILTASAFALLYS
jgi:hypothetical protein